jgi:hypothetical protein
MTEVVDTSDCLTYTEEEFNEIKLGLSEALNTLSRKHVAYFIWLSAGSKDHPGMATSACRTNLPQETWVQARPQVIDSINEHQSESREQPAEAAAALRELLEAISKAVE